MPAESTAATRNHALDLARFVAAGGVITIHCAPDTPAAGRIVDFFLNFSVPFFLLSSLFLFWQECARRPDPTAALLRRLPRLGRPYVAWTVVYLGARLVKLRLTGGTPGSLLTPAAWVETVGAGAAGVQLYFLPLLGLGLGLAWLLALGLARLRGASGPVLGLLLLLGVGLLFCPQDGRVASMASPGGRLLARYFDWGTWLVAPVVLAAGLARLWPVLRVRRSLGWGFIAAGVLADVAIVARCTPYAWRAHSLLLAALLLLGCLHLGAGWRAAPWLAAVARTAFGVFLVHHLGLELIEWFDHRAGTAWTQPYTVGSLLLIGAAVLAGAVGCTQWMQRHPRLARVLLGT